MEDESNSHYITAHYTVADKAVVVGLMGEDTTARSRIRAMDAPSADDDLLKTRCVITASHDSHDSPQLKPGDLLVLRNPARYVGVYSDEALHT